ncbi:MAG: hypothetical protein HC902_02665 [Calothrix sp. SM1_5_4]|nr:hypothetical protein [Calothrix sp. SM1_5_4]
MPVGLERGRPGAQRLRTGHAATLRFQSGVVVEGTLKSFTRIENKLALITWTDCRARLGDRVLFDPAWGEYDMAVGSRVVSVFGGPADRSRFGQTEDFATKRVPPKSFTPAQTARHQLFRSLRELRDNGGSKDAAMAAWRHLVRAQASLSAEDWLPRLELLEFAHQAGVPAEERGPLEAALDPSNFTSPSSRQCVQDGLQLVSRRI